MKRSVRLPVLAPFDRAFDDLRRHGRVLVGPYVLGMLPFTLAACWMLHLMVWNRADALWAAAVVLALAVPWRWLGIAVMQRRLMRLHGRAIPPVRQRWRALWGWNLVAALVACAGLVFPLITLWGMALGALWGVALLVSPDPAPAVVRDVAGRLLRQPWTTGRIMFVWVGGGLLAWINGFALTLFVLHLVLPSLLGVDAPVATRALGGSTMVLGGLYAAFAGVDFLARIMAVHWHAQLHHVRDGGDLALRVAALRAARTPSDTRDAHA